MTPKWLQLAEQDLREGVAQRPGAEMHLRIKEYFEHTNFQATSDEVPWCSAGVCCWVEEAGYKSPHSARAREHMRAMLYASLWRLDEAAPIPLPIDLPVGAICVFARGAERSSFVLDQKGHVGLFYGWDQPGYVLVLGGNQGHRVQVSTYSAEELLFVGWPVRRLA